MVQIATMESETEGKIGKSIKNCVRTSVKSDPAFCLGPTIEETNSANKFGPLGPPLGPPLGYLGSLSQKGLGKICSVTGQKT